MYPQTLYPKTKQVLEKVKSTGVLDNFYLAGGTALALQLGHRKSVDLDFFAEKFPERDLLLQKVQSLNPKISQEAPGTLDLLIDNVKVSFLEYKYPLIKPRLDFEGMNIASVADIACMKLTAISSRGSRKDFVDLSFILKTVSLTELLKIFEAKFKGIDYQKLHIIKSLVFFDEADLEPELDYTKPVDWNKVKKFIENGVKKYLSKI